MTLLDTETLQARAAAIGLTMYDLARAAHLSTATAYRAIQGKNIGTRCLSRLNRALREREEQLRKHLQNVGKVA